MTLSIYDTVDVIAIILAVAFKPLMKAGGFTAPSSAPPCHVLGLNSKVIVPSADITHVLPVTIHFVHFNRLHCKTCEVNIVTE